MSTIHVFAAPDHAQEDDARLCSDGDGGELVIYHPESSATEGGWWMCDGCGTHESDLSEHDIIVSRVL